MHVRGMPPPGFAQPSPLLQVAPAQHASPLAPQGAQLVPASPAAWHERPVVQAFAPPPAQHSSPRAPHALHIPAVHRAPDAVQVIGPPPMPPSGAAPPQQAWLTAPQAVPLAVWHDPLLHVPLVPLPVQAAPLAVHIPPTQQPPL
jgi:hypothetical protein